MKPLKAGHGLFESFPFPSVLFLAFGLFPPIARGSNADGQPLPQTAAPQTLITSNSLELISTPETNYFYFKSEVEVASTNLKVTCDFLEVRARRGGEGDDPEATIGEFGAIAYIEATGNVAITQAGRRAEAGRAVVLPGEGKVVLTESPRVFDRQGEVSGWRITLLKDERRALVENNPEGGEGRPTVILGELPDLGFADEPMEEREEKIVPKESSPDSGPERERPQEAGEGGNPP